MDRRKCAEIKPDFEAWLDFLRTIVLTKKRKTRWDCLKHKESVL